ncbi:NAD(P)-dependent alcohol dehydrogenase [Kineococcus indalonis]|uniref:NAD(P)-dependent alcohol dehydrogenase n=1 Tax=Kineococcus indalonis TaxID=2696566 RepID=UPI0014126A5E|nr:NAD(P)-dependent alcohol dehydrogenase [Kineococcus indalonis]NAZ85725.1 alcohol dehydrogenase catalytic domain-containing protein [Kineococcus indalonis]
MNLSAVLHAPRRLVVEDRPQPAPGPHEVLVRVEAVGICGSDVHYYEHGRIGPYVVQAPMVLGHEAAGTVVAVGEGVDPARTGQRVALEPGVPDRTCEQCLAGRYNLCPNVVFFATPPVDGAIAQHVSIDAAFAHPAPAGLSSEQAAMAEPVSVGVWAARRVRIAPGDQVLVTGAGPIGLLAAQVARAFGADAVTVTDVSDFRLEAARRLGLQVQPAAEALSGTFDVLLECSGAPAAWRSGLAALAPAARAVLVGMGADELPLDVALVQGREITVTGIFRYAGTYPTALELLASGRVQVEPIITHRFALRRTEDALTLSRREPHSLKAVVLPQR